MKSIPSYTKILTLGSRFTENALTGEVIIQEKVDGCVGINERILMKNLEYKPAKDLKIGDEVWGVTNQWHPNKSITKCSKKFYIKNPHNGNVSPKMCVTKVTCAIPIYKDCYEIITNQRKIVASIDHPFLINKKKYYGITKYWVEVKDLKKGDKIVSVGIWERENSYISGYIAGQFDGEGSLGRTGSSRCLSYSQTQGKGIEVIENALIERGFRFSKSSRQRNPKWAMMDFLQIRGGVLECLRFLGTFRPQRLLMMIEKFFTGFGMNFVTYEQIIKLNYIGKQKVMGLSTENGTYITEGLISHNSQFRFGINEDGELIIGSKGTILIPEAPEAMFSIGVKYLLSIKDLILEVLPRDTYCYAEYLNKPKHNVLSYERVPTNNIVLFDIVMQGKFLERNELEIVADNLKIDLVPELYKGIVPTSRDKDGTFGHIDFLKRIIETTPSFLGNELIEGVVIKNYNQTILLGGNVFPLFTKFVREQFKERHDLEWATKSPKNSLQDYIESFKSEARWQKAIYFLRDKGELTQSPKDIGKLIERIKEDIKEEEMENIKDFLYNKFKEDILRKSISGFPEWYKNKLLENLNEQKEK